MQERDLDLLSFGLAGDVVEGGGYTRVVAVKDGKFTPITDWANPERDTVLAMVAERNKG